MGLARDLNIAVGGAREPKIRNLRLARLLHENANKTTMPPESVASEAHEAQQQAVNRQTLLLPE